MSYAVAAVFVTAGIFILGFTLVVIQTRRRIAREWIPIEAVVIESNVEQRGPWAVLVVLYGYHSADIYFEREETISTVFFFSRRHMERLADRYSPGERVMIYVDPDNHQASTLFATQTWISIASMTCAVICLGLGAAALTF